MAFRQSDRNRAPESVNLPPGYRFHPTDEELVNYYLTHKVFNSNTVFQAIGEVDFNRCEPWDLPAKAKVGDQGALYFFSLKDRKYPTGMRTNRATVAGYWKATGKDREVHDGAGRLLGMKKTLVFYTGRAPRGEKTSWIMHEYRLDGEGPESMRTHDEWVVSRVFQKSISSLKKTSPQSSNDTGGYTIEYTAAQAPSFLPALQTLESPSCSNSVKPNYTNYPCHTLAEQQACVQGVTLPGRERVLKRSSSSMKVRRELQLGDSLENLVSGWDMGSPVPIWDVGAGH